MTTVRRTIVSCVTAAVVALASWTAPATAESPAHDRGTAHYEIDFMSGMIDHHAMAVEMGEMCVDKAVHSDLSELCDQIMAAQSSEIETLQSWLEDWYGVTSEPSMTPGQMRQMERMAAMDPAMFEQHFMKMMIHHHHKAIREGTACVDHASHPDLTDLCQNIIDSQSDEVAVMQAWLCDWYDRCRGVHHG